MKIKFYCFNKNKIMQPYIIMKLVIKIFQYKNLIISIRLLFLTKILFRNIKQVETHFKRKIFKLMTLKRMMIKSHK